MTRLIVAFAYLVITSDVSTASTEEPDSVENFLAIAQISVAKQISSGALGDFVREGLIETGLSEVDAKRAANAMARETAECVVGRMREQLAQVDTDDEDLRMELLGVLIKDKEALSIETQNCALKALRNTGLSID
ncbi:MAG: hypothetical protein AAFY15_08955 [Cyanobacteria bacterium J06648_11]